MASLIRKPFFLYNNIDYKVLDTLSIATIVLSKSIHVTIIVKIDFDRH